MNRGTGRMQFTTERVASAVLSVIRFGMGVSRCPNILKICSCQWRFIRRQCASRSSAAGAEENNGDESRENG